MLIVAFIAVGAVVYRATAPPGKPGEGGFSIGRLTNLIKAHVQGENWQAAVTREVNGTVSSEVTRVLLTGYRGAVTVVGEDREDIAAELHATAYGLDDEMAQARAQAITLTLATEGEQITLKLPRLDESQRRPNLKLMLKIPERLACSLGVRGDMEVRGVREARMLGARGKLIVQDVGTLAGDFHDGAIEALRVRAVELTTERTDLNLERIAATLQLEAKQGQVRIRRVSGPTTLRLEHLDCELEGLDGPTRIEMEQGRLNVRGIVAPLDITAERTRVELSMMKAVAVSVAAKFDELAVHLPDDGVTLDVAVDEARIRAADRTIKVDVSDRQQRAQGPVNGGGPTVRLRNDRADIVIR